jgi:hypothetical protein
MCVPYLEFVTHRLLQLHDSVRSARLGFLEKADEERSLQQLLNNGACETRKSEARDRMSELTSIRKDQRDANTFTVRQLLSATIVACEEIDTAITQSVTWSCGSRPEVQAEFIANLQSSKTLGRSLLTEATRLVEASKREGLSLPDELVGKTSQLASHLSAESTSGQSIERIRFHLNEYFQNSAIKDGVDREIAAFDVA